VSSLFGLNTLVKVSQVGIELLTSVSVSVEGWGK
jgi:hypothetical protein